VELTGHSQPADGALLRQQKDQFEMAQRSVAIATARRIWLCDTIAGP
jgi:hypothetical protein